MSHNYNAYQTIKLGENTTERDLYNLFGDTIEVTFLRNSKIHKIQVKLTPLSY